ncbi:Excinuclease ABC subunit A, partial [hydrothermal vent metagenome]
QSYCPYCEIPVETQTTDEVIEKVLNLPPQTKCLLLSPQEVPTGTAYDKLWKQIEQDGFQRVRVDGKVYRVTEVPKIDKRRKHEIEVVVDRITIDRKKRSRIAESVETALELGDGLLRIAIVDNAFDETDWEVIQQSLHFACTECEESFEELTPHNFSFNSPLGWCDECEGLGIEYGTNLSALIGDTSRTLQQGAVSAFPQVKENELFHNMLLAMSQTERIPLDIPWSQMELSHQRKILHGTGDRWFKLKFDDQKTMQFQYKGLYPAIEEASRVSYPHRQRLSEMIGEVPCSACGGSRLRNDAAAVRFAGKTLQQICALPLEDSLKFLKSIKLKATEKKIAGELLTEATGRLSFLVEVGLTYLSMSRSMPTLSGGEAQRIRLAGQIGRALTGVLYVLDEPTIGLHPRDNDRLIQALDRLRKLGNTLVLVEHDREVIDAADRLYDFGPAAGRLGGIITAEGTPRQLQKKEESLTGAYLANKKEIAIPLERLMPAIDITAVTPEKLDRHHTPPGGGWLQLLGARKNNLRSVNLQIPLGTLTCITGVSGSGKSSLIEATLAPAMKKILNRSNSRKSYNWDDDEEETAIFDELLGLENVNKMIIVDQQPLGNTPSSNPATYTGLFDHIRELFVRLPEAKVRGYKAGRFSFNRAGGRCDDCEGHGQKKIEMHFLPDVWVECETCLGKRYNQETLTVKFQGASIADVLEMSIDDALKLFRNIPKIRGYLATLSAIGLGYLTLGQSAPTLSGGEAQRVKLAAELARPSTGKTMYLLDEPTTGLHFDDIAKLLKVLNSLVEKKNTVVVIEHNLDVIKTADWVIDVGPEAGSGGGEIIAAGTPEQIVERGKKPRTNGKKKNGIPTPHISLTGKMLAPVLQQGERKERDSFDVTAAATKQEGDIDLKHVGKNAKMPWQQDGRQWHIEGRVSHRGQPCKWEGKALAWVVDLIEASDQFATTKWNDRSTVEITGLQQKGNWFFHALSGDEWLLTLTFRVPKKTFNQEELQKALKIKKLDQLDELPVYGRGDRVKVKNLKGPFQQVTVKVHWLKEIETEAFKEFLQKAMQTFSGQIQKAKLNLNDLTPWKVLGKKWHLSRKGFPSNKRVQWTAETLEKLFDLLETVFSDATITYSNKTIVDITPPRAKKPIATLHSKRREGIDLSLYTEPGRFALGRFANLAADCELKQHRDGRDWITLRFDGISQVRKKELKQFLQEFTK